MKINDHTGNIIGSWTVIEKIEVPGNHSYLCRCKCGKEHTFSTKRINRITKCKDCIAQDHLSQFIGITHGRITCIGLGTKGKLNVTCACGSNYDLKPYDFHKSESCTDCKHGYYPGNIINGCELIKRIKGKIWEKKCICGKIFQAISSKINCGCVNKNKLYNEAKKKIGHKYGYLKVVKIAGNENGHIQLLLKCKCGNTIIRNNGHEFKGYSCGCFTNLPVGERSNSATLKDSEVISMRELFSSGLYSKEQLSEMFNKPVGYISRIIARDIWKHVP